MTGIIALFGSGEFTPIMQEIYSYLLGQTTAPAVCILPTAAGLEADYHKWIDKGTEYYKSLGAEVGGLEIIDIDSANNSKLVKELDKYTYFVFSGGDPGHLLDTLIDSKAWKKLLELHNLGATIVGSSAGAMVLGSQVWARVYDLEEKGELKPWEKGLGMCNFGVIPHFDAMLKSYSTEEKRMVFENFPKKIKIVGIDEDTAYINSNRRWFKKGKGKVHDPVRTEYV